jgi:flagellar biosynthesis chaperone FliJ
MKRFHFSLERVLTYRRSQADIEKAKLAALESQLTAIREELATLNEAFQREVRIVAAHPTDRAELGRYRMVVETQTLRLNQRIAEKQTQILNQRALYMKANQASEVLTKVKDKQRKTWDQQLQKELDSLAMDSYLARWKN